MFYLLMLKHFEDSNNCLNFADEKHKQPDGWLKDNNTQKSCMDCSGQHTLIKIHSIMENANERNAELYALYRKFMRETNSTHSEAVRAAVNSPASRYWVSPNYLYRMITNKRHGESHSPLRRMKKSSLYDCLYSDFLKMKEQPLCRDLSMEAICDLLVNRPAPSFFLSEKRGDEIIKGYRNSCQ